MRAVDAIIVGAGPVGLTAAHVLHEAGASVLLLEKRGRHQLTRYTMPVLDAGSRELLDSVGLGERLFQRGVDKQGIATRRFEAVLREEAELRGIDARYGARFAITRNSPSDGIEIALVDGPNGIRSAVRGAVLVDATGGKLFTHGPLHLRPLPERTHMVIGRWPYQAHLGQLFDLKFGATPGSMFPGGRAKGIFGPNNAIDGAVGAMEVSCYRMGMRLAQAFETDAAARARLYEQGGREAGLTQGVIEGPMYFELRQQLAQRAREGSIVTIGDSVGKVDFRTADGQNGGSRHVRALLKLVQGLRTRGDEAARRETLFADYERTVLHDRRTAIGAGRLRYHPGSVPPPLPDFPELTPYTQSAAARLLQRSTSEADPIPAALRDGVPLSEQARFFPAVR